MSLLTRYILCELLKVFLLTLTGLTVLIMVVLVGFEAMRQGLGLGPVLRIVIAQELKLVAEHIGQFALPGRQGKRRGRAGRVIGVLVDVQVVFAGSKPQGSGKYCCQDIYVFYFHDRQA